MVYRPPCDVGDISPDYFPFVPFPASYPDVIAVSATGANDLWAENQDLNDPWQVYNFGNTVDVAAPGMNVLSTVPAGGYDASERGTSFAAPHVAALVGLILSVHPSLSSSSIEAIIKNTADKTDDNRFPYENGRNDYLGYGRINAHMALLQVALDLAGSNKSVTQGATVNASQRKLCRESSGKLHEVFESGGEVFCRNSTNDGTTWQVTAQLSSSSGGSAAPCITMAGSTVIVLWQRVSGSSYEIQTSRSTNGGSMWSGATTLATVPCASPGPVPTVSGCDNSVFMAYRTSNGTMNAMKSTNAGSSWTSISAVPGSTSNCNSPSSMMYYTPWSQPQANLAYATNVPTGSPRIYYVYFDYNTNNWGGSSDITSVVPSQYTVHGNPCLAVAPATLASGTVHVVWDASAPAPPPNIKVAIHRKLSFRNPGSTYSVLIGWGENRPSVASVQNDMLWMISQSNLTSYLQKRYFNGSSWQSPTGIALGGFNPQVSIQRGTGAIPAKYLYTVGSQAPYQIVVGSDALAKTGESTIYSRELNVIDSASGESVTFEMGRPSIEMADGSTIPVDLTWSFNDSTQFDLSGLLMAGSTESFTLPDKALRISVPITAFGKNPGAVFSSTGGSLELNLTDAKTASVLGVLSSISSASLPASCGDVRQVSIALNATLTARGVLTLVPSITGLREDKRLIFSLGHVYRAGGMDTLAKETVSEPAVDLPREAFLSEGYPNPFNPATTIRYGLPDDARVSLVIFDALGRTVATLVDGAMTAGYHDVRFNGAGLASGMYIARLQVIGDQGAVRYSKTTKLALMK